jgi:hypothetical protein
MRNLRQEPEFMSRDPTEVGRFVGPTPKDVKSRIPVVPETTTFTNTGFVVQTASQLLTTGNPFRSYLLIQNKSASNIFVSFGKSADTFNGVLIEAGGNYEPFIVPVNDVYVIGSAVNLSIMIVEGVKGLK